MHIQIAPLSLRIVPFFSSLFISNFSPSVDIFELACGDDFPLRDKSVPRPTVYILINIRASPERASREFPLYCAPPLRFSLSLLLSLWISIKINIRTRVSSHRKYAAPPFPCNGRHCFLYWLPRISIIDRPLISSPIDGR